MAHVKIPYTQALWKIQQPVVPSPALHPNLIKSTTPPHQIKIKRPLPPKLSQQIHIRHDGVNDMPPREYWKTDRTVTVLVGDLHRDRLGDKSCVFLYFVELLKTFPYERMDLGMRIRTEAGNETLFLRYGPGGVCDLRTSIEQLKGKMFLFRRSAHVVLWFEDPARGMMSKHFILCPFELFLEATNVKTHFSAVQCFLELSESIPPVLESTDTLPTNPDHYSNLKNSRLDNRLRAQFSNIRVGLPTTLPPDQFALIGILGALSNFPQTGRHLKHVFRLHALGDSSLEVDDGARGYDFAYQRFREYAVNWKVARRCEYREREGLKAKKISRAGDEEVRHWPARDGRSDRPKGRRCVKVVSAAAVVEDAVANGGIRTDDEKDGEIQMDADSEVACPHSTADHQPPSAPLASPSTPLPAPPGSPGPHQPASPLACPVTLPLRPSFIVLGALMSICQQPNRADLRLWDIPIVVQQTVPTAKHGRVYPTFTVYYKARLVEGVVLLQINEQRPRPNHKNCPFGCVKIDTTHQWFSSSNVLSRHLRPHPLAGPCPAYPRAFTALTHHNIHTPLIELVERSPLEIYFKSSAQSSGHFTSMYALSQEMFKLALETAGEECVALWRRFTERPEQGTLDAMMRGYRVE